MDVIIQDDDEDEREDVPAFSKFKNVFESFMEELDLSKTKKDAISKMSPDKKWFFMREYKQSTLNLLVLATSIKVLTLETRNYSSIFSRLETTEETATPRLC